jgi:zinc protease
MSFPVEWVRLANGMRVVFQPDPRTPLVATQICYLAGSAHEPAELSGLAHLCEHMTSLYARGGSDQNYSRLIEQIGGQANGATFHDRTTYSATLISHQLPLAFWVEARRMSDDPAKFTPAALDVQRKIVYQERRERVENRAYGSSFELLQKMLFCPDHPYHRPSAGMREGLQSILCRDVESYFREHYSPDKAILAVTGDFSPDECYSEVERYFGIIPAAERSGGLTPHTASKSLCAKDERREVVASPVPYNRTYIAFRAPGYGKEGWYAASLLLRSMAVGRSSPLQQKLIKEARIAREVQAHMITMREASTIAFTATAAPGVSQQTLEAAMLENIEKLFDEGVPETALQRAQKKVLTDHYAMIQRLGHRADLLTNMMACFDNPPRLENECHHYSNIGSKELVEFIHDFCRPDCRVVLSFVPLRNH